MLFAVIGAKLSEGLNFADDLARAVVIVGLPFPNLGSPELRERMKYVKALEAKNGGPKEPGRKDAAAELYENMCMNAVNQSIGADLRSFERLRVINLADRLFLPQVAPYGIETIGLRCYCWIADTQRLLSATNSLSG